ncbi:PA14 domain-containing protein [Mariniflexile sp. AS56]|uniref:PA14 domain-containing protein n=1 Tax=Mariniflexile sp. AS56 TaxID=3063957 RepID=UPI0026F37069|nr:PA14 domain-containing protein [Mariniflexile sp. AS56]MDO7173764.1 PA14 domain-containing protein [Mariniflexile sp. AS56]
MKKTTMNKMKINKKKVLSFLCFLIVSVGIVHAQFVHPGLSHKKSDLDRMKYMVEAQKEPFYQSYLLMAADSKSKYDYVVQGNTSMTVLYRDAPKTNLSAFENDSRAAYQNALMWSITGDNRHAEKAIEIFNAWTGLTYLQHSGTRALTSSLIYIMLEGAEIIKSTYNGWSPTDINKFKDMLVYPGYSNTAEPSDLTTQGTWYWRAYMFDYVRAGNQEISAVRACLAIGAFLDNEIIYDRALRYVKGLPHRADDLPYASGPHIRGSVINTTDYQINYNYTTGSAISDYGFNGVLTNYIWENGQSQESSRDLWHTWWGEYMLCNIGEIAWNQGADFWGEADSRILLGLEFNNRYTVSYVQSYMDQPNEWTPTAESGEFIQQMDRTNRTMSLAISPIYADDPARIYRDRFNDVAAWELPTAHYIGRGIKAPEEVKWTLRAREKSIEMNGNYETAPDNGSYLGYGGLIFRRADNCYGDPIKGFDTNNLPIYSMNNLPTTIEAENFDYFTTSGEDHTYNDTTISNNGGVYRIDENVDIKVCSEGGYNITDIQDGEWLTYTVNVPADGTYDISIRYASTNANGKIKFNIGGVDVTTEVNVPFGASNSTGLTDWKDFTVASNVNLIKGVQALKVMFSGANNSFDLNSISLNINTLSCMISTTDFTNFKGGINYSYYEGVWNELPDFDAETPIKTGEIAIIDLSEASSANNYGFVFEGYVHAPNSGTYTFYTRSDDGSNLSIEGIKIIDNDGLHEEQESAVSICLNEGYYKIKVEYFTASGSNSALSVMYEGPGISKTTLPVYIDESKVPGQFEFLFDIDGDFEGWTSFNNPVATSMAVISGKLQATYPATNGYLGIQHQADLEFSVDHPYVAIKIDHLPASRMSFYMASGWYNNDKDGFSNVANTTLNNQGIYVFDLSTNGPGFGSGKTQVFASGTNYTDTNRIIFLIDDNNTSSTTNATYNDIEWIKNFASLQDIAAYAGLTLGVNSLKQDVVSIYPNPVKGSFIVSQGLGADVEIYNIVGKLLTKEKIENNKEQIDISGFVSGIYFVRISNNGIMTTKKIIKE